MEFLRLYPDDQAAHDWFAEARWPDGPRCPRCGTGNVLVGTAHHSMPYPCRRGHMGTYHYMSRKHLSRYVGEFAGRHNLRDADTADQLAAMARGLLGKRLPYAELTA